MQKKTKIAISVSVALAILAGSGLLLNQERRSSKDLDVESVRKHQVEEDNRPTRTKIEFTGVRDIVSEQIIVGFSDESEAGKQVAGVEAEAVAEKLTSLAKLEGVTILYDARVEDIGENVHVFRIEGRRLTRDEMDSLVEKIATMSGVAAVDENRIYFPTEIPNDASYPEQWNLKGVTATSRGANAELAWDKTQGNPAAVIAVVDTGIANHSDLNAKVLPGYNFVADRVRAGNGVGRNADPSDLGDFVTEAEASAGSLAGCPVSNSSWHGTHVSGIAAASGNNGVGVTGVDWEAKILPVRVMGKCGGSMLDIITGMRWAAGLPVYKVPTNPNPAKILNLSLGGQGNCSPFMQLAIVEIIRSGSVIVTAAGNAAAEARTSSPGNCSGVMNVGATGKTGDRAWYSNYGAKVMISAPGGDKRASGNDAGGILSTINTGATAPGSEGYAYYQGTSMAAPHVAGLIALVSKVNPKLNMPQVADVVVKTAAPFGPSTVCAASGGCGVGVIDAAAAVGMAEQMMPDFSGDKLLGEEYYVPGLPATAKITIGNAGNMRYVGKLKTKLYLSITKSLDVGGNPTLVGEYNLDVDIKAVGQTVEMLPVTMPADVKDGAYYLIAKLNDEDPAVQEKISTNNEISSNIVSVVRPTFVISIRQGTDQAPSPVRFWAFPENGKLFKLVRGWKYTWSFPDTMQDTVESGIASRGIVGVPGSVAIKVRIESPNGEYVKEATTSVSARVPDLFITNLKTRASNQWMREPVTIAVEPLIKGGHPIDRVTSWSYSLDGIDQPTTRGWVYLQDVRAGEHTITYTMNSRLGQTSTVSKKIVVNENTPPVCSLTYTKGIKEITFNSRCSDSDGKVKGFTWAINDVTVKNAFDSKLIVPITSTGNTITVTLTATDDSGETGTTSVTTSY